MTRAALPSTLDAFLDQVVPCFETLPDADWFEGAAQVYATTPAKLEDAFRAKWTAHRAREGAAAVRPNVIVEPTRRRGFDAVVDAFRRHGHDLKSNRGGYLTRCPLHQDRRPSLQISRAANDPRKAIIYCHSCKGRPSPKVWAEKVLSAIGLTLADLFPDDLTARRATVREVQAEYVYVSMGGNTVATKVRYRDEFHSKRFAWRVGERWSLTNVDKAAMPLYREQDAIDSSLIYLVEGEKAADRLWTAGVPAVCAPNGAGKWEARWTETLRLLGAAHVVILTDNDVAGRQHGEIVAAALHGANIPVQVVALPGLAAGQDVYDWLAAGHTIEELETIVGATAAWAPDLAERLRREKLRAKWASDKRNQRLAKRKPAACPPAYVRDSMSTDVCQAGDLSTIVCQEPADHLRPVGSMSTMSTCPPRERTSVQRSKVLTEIPISLHSEEEATATTYPDPPDERSPEPWRR